MHRATRSTSTEMNSIERCPINARSKRAREVREEIAEYCINEGEVDWQDNYLFKRSKLKINHLYSILF